MGCMDWIDLAQVGNKWQDTLNVIMNLQVL